MHEALPENAQPDCLTLPISVTVVTDADAGDAGVTRRRALELAALGGGALLAGGILVSGLPSLALSAPSAAQDAQILNFALRLEYLQEAFYNTATTSPAVRGKLREFATIVHDHESQHVSYIRTALGSAAIAQPTFNFGNALSSARRFAATAVTLEDLAVAAYNGQAANLTHAGLAAAAKIISVDARHAAWIRSLVGQRPASAPTDTPLKASQVTAAVAATGFAR